ncbi:DUF6325 family protein [Spirillospora sp. NPDC047279]|uniref:DUF6325 family protein n=1 Tax=Spirillospora sp. NPDC047279 TaxID=3155478 RepID=UPI0033E02AD1
MTWGPLEFVVLTFPGPAPGKEAVDALAGLRRAGGVQIVDSLVVVKGADGAVTSTELADIPELEGVVSGRDLRDDLIGAEDADEVGASLDPGTCALAVLVEHAWAREAADAVRDAGGRLAASIRIPAEHIPEKS